VSAKSDAQDLYVKFETELRTPREALLVDAFLPPAAAIPSSVHRPAPPRAASSAEPASDPDFSAALAGARKRADDGAGAAPAPAPRRRSAKRAAEPEKSLEEEIEEFMSRSGGALAPDTDPEGG
jgi:hypothetical protein